MKKTIFILGEITGSLIAVVAGYLLDDHPLWAVFCLISSIFVFDLIRFFKEE